MHNYTRLVGFSVATAAMLIPLAACKGDSKSSTKPEPSASSSTDGNDVGIDGKGIKPIPDDPLPDGEKFETTLDKGTKGSVTFQVHVHSVEKGNPADAPKGKVPYYVTADFTYVAGDSSLMEGLLNGISLYTDTQSLATQVWKGGSGKVKECRMGTEERFQKESWSEYLTEDACIPFYVSKDKIPTLLGKKKYYVGFAKETAASDVIADVVWHTDSKVERWD